MAKRVLVIAPHPDDESIGCGGGVCVHRREGDAVRVAFLTSGEQGNPSQPPEAVRTTREAEAEAACAVLGVEQPYFLHLPDLGVGEVIPEGARALAEVLAEWWPDFIYLPHPDEEHPDHEAALPLVRAALAARRAGPKLPELRGYEVWTPMSRVGWTVRISEVMRQKLRAIGCYPSQLELFRYDYAVRGLNRYRGIMAAGCRYAEAYQYLAPRAE